MYGLARALLFRLDPETAHDATLRALAAAHAVGATRALHPRLPDDPVQAMGLTFPNPVGLAAGPGDAERVAEVARRRFGGWGGLITGTAERVAEQLSLLARRGVERFYLQFSDFATAETLERFGAEVIPAITGTGAR